MLSNLDKLVPGMQRNLVKHMLSLGIELHATNGRCSNISTEKETLISSDEETLGAHSNFKNQVLTIVKNFACTIKAKRGTSTITLPRTR